MMIRAKSLIDSLLNDLMCGQGAESRAAVQASARVAPAGGALCVMSGRARRIVASGAASCGAALIGGMACKAYGDWKSGKASEPPPGPVAVAEPVPLPDAAFAVTDDCAERLLQAMVAAAKADGHVTQDERVRIEQQLSRIGLGLEAQALIAAELDSPLNVGRIAALARTEAEAVEIYTASVLVVTDGAPNKGYLASLAAHLCLDAKLVAHVHAEAFRLA